MKNAYLITILTQSDTLGYMAHSSIVTAYDNVNYDDLIDAVLGRIDKEDAVLLQAKVDVISDMVLKTLAQLVIDRGIDYT